MARNLIISLSGPDLSSGEIGLADLAGIGDALQQLALRIGRQQTGQGGPGRSANAVERATRLRLRALRAGSVVLDVAVGEDLVLDDGIERRTVDRLHDIVAGMAADTVPYWVTPLISESALRTLDALTRAATECEINGSGWPAPVRFTPARAGRAVWSATVGNTVAVSSTAEVSGVLEAVDLKPPGRFRLRDDVGNAIPLERVDNIDEARTLIGTRVTAVGAAAYSPTGQLLRLTDSTVTGVELPEWTIASSAAVVILNASSPATTGIEGVDEDEVTDFLEIVRG